MHLTTLSPAPANPLPPPVPSLPGRTLVVDDNEAIRTFLRYFFKLENLPVEIVASGPAALERLRAAPKDFALMITDCEMPGMTGLELARQVRALRADLPMILFSTSVSVHGPERFLTLGFVEALPKPVGIDKLRAAVRNTLARELPPAAAPGPVSVAPA